jgi:amino acid adenylation domain-containing protein
LLPKGTPLILAILGTLKAGKICVPLDPTLPQNRISHMLDNAQASLIVTSGDYLAMGESFDQPRQCLNIDELDYTGESKGPTISLGPDDFAYIFYTSGSTGLPKGVSENHRNLLFHVMAETNEYRLCADDRLVFLAASGRDVLRALLNGACVYPFDIKKEGLAGLADWLIQERITIFNGVVTAFRHLVATLSGNEQFPHLRLIKLVGEMVHAQDVELYQKYFSADCIFINSYGPNEAGHVCHYFVDKNTQVTTSSVPVGYPVDGKDIMVLDDEDHEVAPETIGQIAVRSRYLSPGYWRRPDLTRAKFRHVDSGALERIYFTGDLGRVDADGCLVLLGRQDFQVKIRGNRVEIAEVEMALLDLETVKEAVVVAREDASGQKRLVAYLVPATQPAPTVTSLRNGLADKLPDYMIPSAFVCLDALPVIGIGKVNRQALLDPGGSRPNLDTPFALPTNPNEELLAQIWAEVLALDRVGIHDSFFDLGGHSLAATRVVSRIIQEFQLEIPLQSLLRCPTVAELAAVINEHQGKKPGDAKLERLLKEVESLSDEQARLLVNEGMSKPTGK